MSQGAWRRRIGFGLLMLMTLALGFSVWARLLAGGPIKFFPGGVLRGEEIVDPVSDWSFVASHQYLDVESRARWLPYSRSTWFMVHDGDLFILTPRLFGSGLEDYILEDPAVRIRIDGRVYTGRVKPEGDETTTASLLAPLVRRSMSVEISGAARPASNATALPHGGIGLYRFTSSSRLDR